MGSRAPRPEALFVAGALSQYLGAAVAANLFDELAPSGVALLRVLGAALIIVALRRSWRRRWQARELARAAAFGVSLAAMNLCFYLAMERLPLGNAVAIEFTGPVAVAALGARTLRSVGVLLLAAAGVVVLAGVEADGTARGVAFALLAGAFWAGYILLGHPGWQDATIKVFAALPKAQVGDVQQEFSRQQSRGRLPIGDKNIEFIPTESASSFRAMVEERSRYAALVVLGFSMEYLHARAAAVFTDYPTLRDVLFVNTPVEVSFE